MGAWRRLDPVEIDRSKLPEQWEVIQEPVSGHYAVVGRSDPDSVDVVVRIDYAVCPEGRDIRSMIGTAIAVGMQNVVRNHRKSQQEQRGDL